MRISHVHKDYAPVSGGIERHLRVLARGQAERGHEVAVAVAAKSLSGETSYEHGAVLRRYGGLATVRSTPICPELLWTVRRCATDLVHLHFPHPPGEIAWATAKFGPPALVSYHADIVKQKALALIPTFWHT